MNPQSKLTLNGDMMLTGYLSPATGSRFIGIDRNQDSNIKGSWIEFESLGLGFGDGQSIHFGTHHSGFSNARRMTILNTGNVGVGTTSPVAGLHVHTASGIAGLRLESGNSSALFKMKGGGADPEESVWQLNTFSSSGTGYFRLSAVNDAENAAVQAIEIKRSLGTAVESVTFPSGNIGIGTTTPGYLLHVNSGATPTSSQVRLTANGAGSLSLMSYAPDNGVVAFDNDFTGNAWTARHSSAAQIYKNAGALVFFGNSGLTAGNTFTPTEKMRLDLGTGNVGIELTCLG